MNEIEFDYPWQVTPTKLIQYGLENLRKQDEFNKQVAFLLIDVGVENLFKVYLSLDDEIIQSNVSYHKRQKAVRGSFYDLVEMVKKSTSSQINDDIFEKVKYFHKIRNKLYHQGDGVLPTNLNLRNYANISKTLLKELLKIDLYPEGDFEDRVRHLNEKFAHLNYTEHVNNKFVELKHDLSGVIGHLKPEWVKRSFVDSVHSIWEKYPDDIDDDPKIWEEHIKKRKPKFNKLIGKEIDDPWFIKEACRDIHFLYLALVLQKTGELDYQELEKYVSARMFSETEGQRVGVFADGKYQLRDEKFDGERANISDNLVNWMESVQKRIDDMLGELIQNPS